MNFSPDRSDIPCDIVRIPIDQKGHHRMDKAKSGYVRERNDKYCAPKKNKTQMSEVIKIHSIYTEKILKNYSFVA
jgi:hypothetical protein